MTAAAAKQNQSGKRLLVVEDSLDFQLLLRQLFESEGYQVEYASNGEEALKKLQAQADLPHLILLDLMMPVMDGFEFRKQQEQDPRLAVIPVVLMTAHGDAQTSKMRIGAKDYIRKPADLDKLLSVVRRNCS